MDIKELQKQLEAKKVEIRSYAESDDFSVDKAEEMKSEIRNLEGKIEILSQEQEQEKRSFEDKMKGEKEMETRSNKEVSKEIEYRALVKKMIGSPLTDEEKRAITDGNFNSNTGAIIPSEFINKVKELQEGKKSLKAYCDVIPVTSDNGKMPTTFNEEMLADLEEDTDMVESMLDTKEVDFKVSDKGLLKKVGNNILKDSPVNFIEKIIAPAFARASINRQNKDIVSAVASNVKTVSVASGKNVEDVLATQISKFESTLRDGAVIITNKEGYAYLDNLKDGQNQQDFRVSYRDGSLYFKNQEVIDLPDNQLPTLTSTKTMVFYIANLKTISFFDREQMEIAKSTEAGFIANKTLVRVIERYDVETNPYEVAKAVKIEN